MLDITTKDLKLINNSLKKWAFSYGKHAEIGFNRYVNTYCFKVNLLDASLKGVIASIKQEFDSAMDAITVVAYFIKEEGVSILRQPSPYLVWRKVPVAEIIFNDDAGVDELVVVWRCGMVPEDGW